MAQKTVLYYNEQLNQHTGLLLTGEEKVTKVPKGWKKFPEDWTEPPKGSEFVGSQEAGFEKGE